MSNSKNSDDDLEQEVMELAKVIEIMIENQRNQGADPNEWLRTLHQDYNSRFLSDNERIWTVGSILIPVSVAGFGAFVTIESPQWWQAAVLMFGSVSLIFIWIMIAERHRAFQENWEKWLLAIERTIQLSHNKSHSRIEKNRLEQIFTLRFWRWTLFGFILIGWIMILILTTLGYLGV